jgi:hypothetical protein
MPDANPKPTAAYLVMSADRDLNDVLDQSVQKFKTLPEARSEAQYWQDVNGNTAGHHIIQAVTAYRVLETTPAALAGENS